MLVKRFLQASIKYNTYFALVFTQYINLSTNLGKNLGFASVFAMVFA